MAMAQGTTMTGKTNIFKANDAPTSKSGGSPAGPKGNIFKSASVDDHDSSPEEPIEQTQRNIFKDIPVKTTEDERLKPNLEANYVSPHQEVKSDNFESHTTEAASSKQSLSRLLSKVGFVGAGGLLGLSIGVYFFLSSEGSPQPTSKTTTQAAEITQLPATNQNPGQAIVSQPASTGTYTPYLSAMLQAAHDRSRVSIENAVNALDAVQRPSTGNRAAARNLNEQGLAALKSQDFLSAINAFRLGITEDPGNVELINNLGFALYKSGQTSLAKEQIELALVYSPKRSSAWVNLGDILFKEGNDSNAIDAYVLAYAFSNNKDRLYRTVESLAENDPDSYSRIFYTKVLATLRQNPL